MSESEGPISFAAYTEDLAEFERVTREFREGHYKLRLFVTGSTPRSVKAITNIRAICDEHLAGRYDLEVVDLYLRPDLAREEHVMAAPTLVREEPVPVRKVVGDMSD